RATCVAMSNLQLAAQGEDALVGGVAAVAALDVDAVAGVAAGIPVEVLEVPGASVPPRVPQRPSDVVVVEVVQLPAVDDRAVPFANAIGGLVTAVWGRPTAVQDLAVPRAAEPIVLQRAVAAVVLE